VAESSTRFHRCGPLPGGGRETSLTLDRPDHKSSGEGGGHPPKRPRARSSRKPEEGEKARWRGGEEQGWKRRGRGGEEEMRRQKEMGVVEDMKDGRRLNRRRWRQHSGLDGQAWCTTLLDQTACLFVT